MKSIILCGSIACADEIIKVRDQLETLGFDVEIPYGVYQYIENGLIHKHVEERAVDKKDQDLISRYYEMIKEYDAVLIVNVEKNGKSNYIGGNTFLEMGFAHVLGKPLFVLNPLPEVMYRDELEAMCPVILNKNLSLLRDKLQK
jgi:nucleoside 2-deoxyribosyltransferase